MRQKKRRQRNLRDRVNHQRKVKKKAEGNSEPIPDRNNHETENKRIDNRRKQAITQ
jgi:hypothetical protein